jgi:ATP-dependent helicase/nuclease subunit A
MVSYREAAHLSPAQRAVLFDAAPRALVSAGAGSGKTKLLVSYFVHALLDEQVPLDRLAAVTFTRKAGFELAERIRRELVEQGRPDLARSLDGAAIGTIHGLCRRILADQALAAGVDPSFGVLEADSEKLIKQEVFRQAWTAVVSRAGEEELQVFAAHKEARLRESVISLYGRLRGMGQEVPQVRIRPGPAEPEARSALAAACQEALAAGRSLPKRGVALDADLQTIVACVRWLESTPDGPKRESRVADTLRLFPTYKTAAAEAFLAPVRDALSRYRLVMAEAELRPLVSVLNSLLAAFHDAYGRYKEARGVLDFTDLELRARALLLGSTAADSGPASVATPLSLSRLLVDEFQDTNELQCSILEGLGAERMLMVGDARQSIYRFRGADVEVFRRREEAPGLSQHRLDVNYRSSAEVLAFIDHLFSQEMFFGSRFNRLIPGRPEPGDAGPGKAAGPGPATEVLVAERTVQIGEEAVTLDKQQAEAYAAGRRIRSLVDEEGWAQRDIVVLLPALSRVDVYQDALLSQGLHVYVVGGKGYYSQDEVEDVAALLRLLVDPHDDLSLLTVLRSPMVGVSDDCLYLLGRARGRRSRSLWAVLREGCVPGVSEADLARLHALAAHLDVMRVRVGRQGLARLIDDAVSALGYDVCLLAAPHGRRRFANLRKLMRMAADYEALEGPDLAGFVALIGSLGDLGDDEGSAPSLAEDENVVRVMSVHQAKGLEFPVVVLAGLGSDPYDPAPDDVLVAPDGRMAALVKGAEKHKSEACQPCWGPAAQIIADDQARKAEEDVRLLYVAMTRASERLVLVGARRATDKPGAFRIGRIVSALGCAAPPAPLAVVELPHIHARLSGVDVGPDAAATDAGGAEAASQSCADSVIAEPPCFLELPGPSAIPRQVSFSALSAFGRCPRQFYLQRVLGLGSGYPFGAAPTIGPPVDEGDGPEVPASGAADLLLDAEEHLHGRDIGILVHSLLEGQELAGSRPAPRELLAQVERSAAELCLDLSAPSLARAAQLAAAFWDTPVAGLPGLLDAQREAPFSFVQEGILVQGVIDLLLRSPERWTIVDYKTNALGGREPADLAAGYGLQACLYCLAALKAGAPAVLMQFVFLDRPEQPVSFEYAAADQEGLDSHLGGVLASLFEGRFPACVGPSCGDCPVQDLCSAMNSRAVVVE